MLWGYERYFLLGGFLANLEEANPQNLNFGYNGHPAPEHSIHQSQILLNFSVPDILSEAFFPSPSEINVRISQKGLKLAVKTVFQQLDVLSQKILKINQQLGFNIPDLDKLLLFGQEVVTEDSQKKRKSLRKKIAQAFSFLKSILKKYFY